METPAARWNWHTNCRFSVADQTGWIGQPWPEAIEETIMARKKQPIAPNTAKEEVPPGATTRAADRPIHQGGGPAGSGAGPRHAANDPGTPDEEYGAVDSNDPLADGTLIDPDEPIEEELEAYGGFTGGAVGGTPAGRRATGGHIGRGIRPGTTRHSDTTVGLDPETPSVSGNKKKKG
jgi:hypothetical protein